MGAAWSRWLSAPPRALRNHFRSVPLSYQHGRFKTKTLTRASGAMSGLARAYLDNFFLSLFKNTFILGNSLAVQWLGLRAFTARGRV